MLQAPQAPVAISRTRPAPDAGFMVASGPPYARFLRQIHGILKPEWYLEIGTNRGASLKLAPGKSVAVDPRFTMADKAVLEKPACLFFQQTSDDFFANPTVRGLGLRYDLAFLDGLHLFEFLLRDLMNTERCMTPGGVVLMHDTAPFTHNMTARTQVRGAWTGDVWKVLPILRRYRPEVTITHLDLAPTGLAMLTGLGTGNTALDDNYDAIMAEFLPMTLADYNATRYFDEFPLVDAMAVLSELEAPAEVAVVAAVDLPAKAPKAAARSTAKRKASP